MFDLFGDGEDQLFFVRAADHLDADGKAVRRDPDGYRSPGKSCQIEPLGIAHGVAIAMVRAGMPGAFAVAESGSGRNGRKQNRDVLHLAENLGADKIAPRACVQDLVERWRSFQFGDRKIFAQHRADLIFVAVDRWTKQMRDQRTEEEPPQIDRAIET